MKTLFGALVIFSAMLPALASAQPICGTVYLGQCDVDYCHFKFGVQRADGTWDQYGLKKDGQYIAHDYQLDTDLEAMADKNYCTDSSKADSFGAIEVGDLVPQN